ncbi:unnamed protein product [Rhizophagus irregularis]|nr:unnamed protein product [Rhizophagus irregularis]
MAAKFYAGPKICCDNKSPHFLVISFVPQKSFISKFAIRRASTNERRAFSVFPESVLSHPIKRQRLVLLGPFYELQPTKKNNFLNKKIENHYSKSTLTCIKRLVKIMSRIHFTDNHFTDNYLTDRRYTDRIILQTNVSSHRQGNLGLELRKLGLLVYILHEKKK